MIRDAEPEDYPAIQRIHAEMGMDYALPELDGALFFVKKVTVDENDNVIGACFLRIAAECYLWLSPELSPRDKVSTMSAMQPEVLSAAWQNGLDFVEARIPVEIEVRFQKRLRLMGWSPNRDGWRPWTVNTHA